EPRRRAVGPESEAGPALLRRGTRWQEEHRRRRLAARHDQQPRILGLELRQVEEGIGLTEIVVLDVVTLDVPLVRGGDERDPAAGSYAMPSSSAAAAADGDRRAARVAGLERERTHLLAVIEILKEVSTSLHFIDILQAIARKLGEAFGLDRCSIFLADRGGRSVRLVASYEDPTIRNYVVDLERYPELKRAMQSGETVFIPDAATDPSLKHVKSELINRRV